MCGSRNTILLAASVVMIFIAILHPSDARFLRKPGFKQARSTRGFKEFKDGSLQVGRGFGKRASENSEIVELPGDSSSLDDLEGIEGPNELTGMARSFPLEWIAEKMANNPAFAMTILRKFVDVNEDGQVTMQELLRPTATF